MASHERRESSFFRKLISFYAFLLLLLSLSLGSGFLLVFPPSCDGHTGRV